MTIEDIEKLMDKFYDIYEDVDEQVFEKLNSYFFDDKEGFKEYVNSQPIGLSSYRAILYESIMDNANGWEDFLLEQIEYIINECDSGNKEAEHEISSIYYLTNISDLNSAFYTSTIKYLRSKLNSSNKEVRKAALEYIVDLHFEGKLIISDELKSELQNQLNDKIYNVRLYAYLNLKDDDLLPKGFKQNTMDKIRTWMSPSYRSYLRAKKIGTNAAERVIKNEL